MFIYCAGAHCCECDTRILDDGYLLDDWGITCLECWAEATACLWELTRIA